MLPAYRTEGEAFAIPKFELTPQDVDGFLDELRAFHHHFRACFARSEPREHFFNYRSASAVSSNANRSSRWRSTSPGATSGGCNAA